MRWFKSRSEPQPCPQSLALEALETSASMIESALLELSVYMPDTRLVEVEGGYGGFVYKGMAGEAVMGPGGRLRTILGADGQECYSIRRDRTISNLVMAQLVLGRLLDEMTTVIRQCELTRSF